MNRSRFELYKGSVCKFIFAIEMEGNPNVKNSDQSKKSSRSSKEPMKVKYIENPVMVNAKDASEFKAIVQELTGKDSGGSRGNSSRRSPGSGTSGTGMLADERRLLPELGYGKDRSQSFGPFGFVEYDKELVDDFFVQVSHSLSRIEFP